MKKKMFLVIFLNFLAMIFLSNAKCQADSNKVIKLLIMNDNRNRPIALNKEDFWKSNLIDTITFTGDVYFELVKYQLSKLKPYAVLNNFSVEAAIIFYKNSRADTVYTDVFFSNWLIGSNSFSDTGDFLEKMFRPLYLGRYVHMRKGED